MDSPKTLFIILATAFLSFTGGYSAYFLPQVLGSRAASITNRQPDTSNQIPIRASMRLELKHLQGGRPDSLEVKEINQGDTLDLVLIINANGQVINGADSLISFDPEIIEIEEIKEVKEQPFAQNEQTAVQSVFNFVRKEVRNGKIYLTAVKETADEIPTDELTLVTITLKGLKAGSAALNLDHFPGKTYGSTIIRAEDSENILDEVEGVRVEISK